ncbi:MAG: DNA-binding response regulator [Anaerolineaceae bacterium]|nr:MAG: DNA-binding response regulator [Anaerolineaceae bacterium]
MNQTNPIVEQITVAVIEDHPIFREGLAKTLSLEPDIRIVGYAGNGHSGVKLVSRVQPDVAIVDMNLPDINGLRVTQALKVVAPNTDVIILTGYHEEEHVLYALQAGAKTYCSKDISADALTGTIRAVAGGCYVINGQAMNEQMKQEWVEARIEALIGTYDDDMTARCFTPLSPRETEVLYAVIHGMSNKEMSLALGISRQTVKNHMTSILHKMNVRDRTQAAVTAIRHGWVRLHDDNPTTGDERVTDEATQTDMREED